jgi:hypothetical protein
MTYEKTFPLTATTIIRLPATVKVKVKGKATPVTDRETPMVPHILDSRLAECGEVSLTRLPAALYPQEDSWYLFLLGESTPGP